MGRMTISVPNELLIKLKKQTPEINWAEVARQGIINRLEKLEKLEKRGEL